MESVFIQNQDAMAAVLIDALIVGGDNYGCSPFIEVFKEIHYQTGIYRVEIAGWLIGKEQRRVISRCPGNGDPLLLTPGQIAGKFVFFVGKGQTVQEKVYSCPDLTRRGVAYLHGK